MSVEFSHVKSKSNDAKSEIITFMESKGYVARAEVINKGGFANDIIFVQRGFNEDIQLKDSITWNNKLCPNLRVFELWKYNMIVCTHSSEISKAKMLVFVQCFQT